jgi:hypothetical protein
VHIRMCDGHMLANARYSAHPSAHARAHTHAHTRTHTQTHTRACTHTRARTHARTHARTQAHTHPHAHAVPRVPLQYFDRRSLHADGDPARRRRPCTPDTRNPSQITSKLIPDQFHSLDEVQAALRSAGLERLNFVVGIDFTSSNCWDGESLHDENLPSRMPYAQAIQAVKTLSVFDDDNLIPCYGFGCDR